MDDAKLHELAAHGHYYSVPRGVSMWPMLLHRTSVVDVVPPHQPLKKYDVALYYRPATHQYVLHRILGFGEGVYYFYGDNCWQRETVPRAAVVGVAAQFRRRRGWMPVTDLRYRCYVHLWCDFLPVRCLIFRLRDATRRRNHNRRTD